VQATVHVSYKDDVVKVLQNISDILKESDIVLETPAPSIFVAKLDDSWLEVSVWPWTKTETWWDLVTTLPMMLQTGLIKRGVTVPYPRREIDVSPEVRPGTQPG
jgi:small-conductance mechanosensitive channel